MDLFSSKCATSFYNARRFFERITPHNPKAVGSNPAPATILNESRFSNNFVEKRDLSYLKSLAMWDFSLSVREPSFFLNSLNAKLIFLRKATI